MHPKFLALPLIFLAFLAGIFLFLEKETNVGKAADQMLGTIAASQQPLPLTPTGTTTYVYGSKLIASKKEGITYHAQDLVGTNSLVFSQAGTLQGKSAIYPYGKNLNKEGHSQTEQRYVFTGKEDDGRLSYFGARYYDQRTGRFASIDPLSSSHAHYDYANDNPLKFNDPTGKDPLIVFSGTSLGILNIWLARAAPSGKVILGAGEGGAESIYRAIKKGTMSLDGDFYATKDLDLALEYAFQTSTDPKIINDVRSVHPSAPAGGLRTPTAIKLTLDSSFEGRYDTGLDEIEIFHEEATFPKGRVRVLDPSLTSRISPATAQELEALKQQNPAEYEYQMGKWVSRTAQNARWMRIGGIASIVGMSFAAANVANAATEGGAAAGSNQLLKEANGFMGGMIGGALAGSAFGPVGALAGGCAGGICGYNGGDLLNDYLTNPEPLSMPMASSRSAEEAQR